MSHFDPYQEWLGIRSSNGSPNHYELLGLKLYESDREHIENAEMMQMVKVLRHEGGEHSDLAARLARELEEAVRCLSDPVDKAAYDADLFTILPSRPSPAADFEISPALVGPRSIDLSDDVLAGETPHPSASAVADENPASHVLASAESATTESTPSKAGKSWLSANAGPASSVRHQSVKDKAPSKETPAKIRKPSKSRGISVELPSLSGKPLILVAAVAVLLGIWIVPGYLSSRSDRLVVSAQIKHADPVERAAGIGRVWDLQMSPGETGILLLDVLKQDPDDNVRIAAANSLVRNGSPSQQTLTEIKSLLTTEKNSRVKALLQWMVDQSGSSS